MPSKKHNQLLARVNFPPYTVHSLTERHVLVAGGGGGSKTGIPNVIEIYELIYNGSKCRAESVIHYETGSEAIMNCTVHNAGKYCILFAGMEGKCHIYKIKHDILDEGVFINDKVSGKQNRVTSRKPKHNKDSLVSDVVENSHMTSAGSDANANLIQTRLCFHIEHLDSFQTDFSDDPFQKLVRFSCHSNLIATAGSDGHIRLWKHPELNKIHDIEAHTDDVDDLDICPLGEKIVSVSRDAHGKVWNAEDGSLISELQYTLPVKSSNTKYIFRSCRFGIGNDKSDLTLFTTLNPAVRKRPPSQCYICKWNAKNFSLQKVISAGTDMLSAMAVSDDGRFIGLGTQDGSVKMYSAFNLQLVYSVDHVHGIFVTGLEFLPTREESKRITGGHEASLISISVDNHINIHHIPTNPPMGILTLISLLILTLLTIFVLTDFFNL